MQAGCFNIGWAGVGAYNIGPKPRHGFAQQAATAANVEKAQAGKGLLGFRVALKARAKGRANIPQTDRIELMQGAETCHAGPTIRPPWR